MKSAVAAQARARKKASPALSLTPKDIPRLLKEHELRMTIIGLGRIGLPTAAVFAEAGARVRGLDIDEGVVRQTNDGQCRLVDEPGLQELIIKTAKAKSLTATTKADEAIPGSHFIIICVPTPVDESKSPNYDAIKSVSLTVGRLVTRGSVVIVESTVGPGFVENVIAPIMESASGMRAGRDFGLASCPERSDPGSIVKNMHTVPRIVGCSERKCSQLVASLYHEALGVNVVEVSNPKTANAVKLTENLFRDVNIALANEFALLYEKFDIDTFEVINACATKYNFIPHYPGTGVGGPCLPINSYYLIVEAIKVGNIPYLIRLAREINDRMPEHMVELTSEALNEVGKTVRGSRIAILGVTYKPGVRDVQLSPVNHIITRLLNMGAEVRLYDPLLPGETVMGLSVSKSIEEAVAGADCILMGTGHEEFKSLRLPFLAKLASNRAAIVDGRSIFEPAEARRAGFAYRGVGKVTNSQVSASP